MKESENLRSSDANRTVILIAEDELGVARMVKDIFEREGYFILVASDGENALRISRQYSGTIHLLLSDINMPKLNGLELREQLLKERSEIKVLLMSGGPAPVGHIPLLRKPFQPKTLLEKVRMMTKSPVLFPTSLRG